MKLLKLLVQEKVQWPDGALWVVQDGDKELKFDSAETPPDNPKFSVSGTVWYPQGAGSFCDVYLDKLASDWNAKAISKAEYDAAVDASKDVCPGDASCTDPGCPCHYASDVATGYQPAYVPMQEWYVELAPIIAAAAEGKVVQYLAADGNWYDGSGAFIHPNKYRIKPEEPKTIKVNGFDVPEPMREAPVVGTRYYVPITATADWFYSYLWDGEYFDVRILQRGAVHTTKEAAVAHAKAMLGIDPYATEDADDEHP